ncbi:type II secretion system protein GspM [Acidisoma sp. 7E03]
MRTAALSLPEGRRGQWLALGITILAAGVLWLALAAPLLSWYAARQETLLRKQAVAARMAGLEHEVPALRRAVARLGAGDGTARLLLAGDSDAIAGANLQSALQALAARAGTSLDSIGMQPARAAQALRLITAQVSLTAPWPVLLAFLSAVETAEPRMIVDSINLNLASVPGSGAPRLLQADLSVTGFRAGGAP